MSDIYKGIIHRLEAYQQSAKHYFEIERLLNEDFTETEETRICTVRLTKEDVVIQFLVNEITGEFLAARVA